MFTLVVVTVLLALAPNNAPKNPASKPAAASQSQPVMKVYQIHETARIGGLEYELTDCTWKRVDLDSPMEKQEALVRNPMNILENDQPVPVTKTAIDVDIKLRSRNRTGVAISPDQPYFEDPNGNKFATDAMYFPPRPRSFENSLHFRVPDVRQYRLIMQGPNGSTIHIQLPPPPHELVQPRSQGK